MKKICRFAVVSAEVEVELLSAGFRAERRKEVKEDDGDSPSAVEYVRSARNCEGL